MQIVLTEEEYIALKAKSNAKPDLHDYRKRLENTMFPFLMQVIREAQLGSFHLEPEELTRRVAKRWAALFESVPIEKP